MADWKNYLTSIYYDVKHPSSYAGPAKLHTTVSKEGKFKIGRRRIQQWLQDQEAYSMTRQARRKFPRSRVIVAGIDSQWDMDLMDMVNLGKHNDQNKYVLVAIDIFSRHVWCQPVQSKGSSDMTAAMKQMLSETRHPKTVRTDRGMEFRSKVFNTYLKEREIHHFYALNTETKANYVERVIKTLKHKLFRYLLKHNTKRYIDILQDVVYSYNHTIHRSIGRSPASVSDLNEGESRLQQYMIRTKTQPQTTTKPRKKTKQRYKYKEGQTVRISHVRSVFDREYSQKWTGELFKIRERFKREDVPVYTLKDWSGEDIEGSFYEAELQAVNTDEFTEYRVEKVLKKRSINKRKEVLVRWLHWPSKFDSWIAEGDLKHYS